ncbi:MAG: hypothetical protein KF688_01780 [Pirellulales bacterium]|nr:hypothetical protein [Pirellulales bacterium]
MPRFVSCGRWAALSAVVLAAVGGACRLTSQIAAAQQPVAMPAASPLSPEQMKELEELAKKDPAAAQRRAMEMMGRPQPGGPPVDKPKESKPGEQKADEGKKPESSGGEASTVKRPDKPETKADPAELKIAPDEQGRVRFSFHGQPWKDVLQWYADVANYSFDWTELPGDYLNLTTTRSYTLDETRDLLNRHLMARGYTLLVKGEILSAVKIDKLDPSLIPQVDPDSLEDYPPHEFVRARFVLPATMEAEKAKEDVKILLSPNARVVPLLASKQLMVIDAVVNLRDVRDLLYGEQMAIKEDVRPRPFMIRYQRADWIADQVMVVLGMDPAARKGPQEVQLEQQRMQMMMQMQQRGADVSKMLSKDSPPVHIAVDKRRNALLVNAPPEQMAIIERTVAELDVPSGDGDFAAAGAMEMRKYRTVTTGPDAIVNALKEIGSLDPLTQLQTDAKSKTIFAYATARDHESIQRMIDKLDGSGRGLHVIPLSRRSAADQVAGTIQALMVGEKKPDNQNNRQRSYMFYGWGGPQEEETQEGDFRIQPDVEQNRLLLWATEAEYEEVMALLTKLGVVPTPGVGGDRLRVYEAQSPEETARLLEQLQKSWQGKNPLIINGLDSKQDAPAEEPRAPAPQTEDKVTRIERRGSLRAHFVAAPVDEEAAAGATAPPITLTVTPDGRLVLSSADPAALDQLEELMAELQPPQDEFAVFRLSHADVYYVYLNLKDYFAEELKGQKEPIYDYWGDYRGSRDKAAGPATLGRRRPLQFIWDIDTNTILVQGASKSQLAVIEKLIKIYDEPVGEDAVASRRTEAIPIRYSRAQDIATALKEVYRDLLSSKDKEFANGGRDGQRTTRNETYYRFYGGGDSDDKDKKSAPVKMAFEGALSIGVDEISNTLIISAEEQVWTSIREIVVQLDERANPESTVEVVEVRGNVTSAALKSALAQALSQPWPGGKPSSQGAQGQGQSRGGEGRNGENRGNQQRNRGDRR